MKTSLINAAILLASIAVTLLAIEVFLRLAKIGGNAAPKALYYRQVEGSNLHAFHSTYGWTTVPNAHARITSPEYDITVENNSLGTRGPEAAVDDRTKGCRVLVVGDSFVAGYTADFDEHFTQVAERIVEAALGRDCEVIADGVEGFSTDQELLRYRDVGRSYKADHVVLAMFFNDVYQNGSATTLDGSQGKPVFEFTGTGLTGANIPVPDLTSEAKAPARGRSLTDRIRNRLRTAFSGPSRIRTMIRSALASAELEDHEIPLRSGLFRHEIPANWGVYSAGRSEELAHEFNLTEQLVLQIRKEVEADGSGFSILHVPNRSMIYDEDWRWARVYHGLDEDWDIRRFEEFARGLCADNGMFCMLPAAELAARAQASGDAERLYLINDPHWSKAGHLAVGEIMAEYLLNGPLQP